MKLIFETPIDLMEGVGKTAGPTDWVAIEQSRINMFADATDDHQWIHTDPERAASGPFGGAIAHGYLTLAMVNRFLPDLLEVKHISMGVNYGCGKVRFPNVVKAGARIRGRAEVIDVEEVKGGVQSTVRVTIEVEGEDRPACIADTISRYYPEKES